MQFTDQLHLVMAGGKYGKYTTDSIQREVLEFTRQCVEYVSTTTHAAITFATSHDQGVNG